jgi:hypothetical protein
MLFLALFYQVLVFLYAAKLLQLESWQTKLYNEF